MNTRRLALSVVTAAALVSLSACTDGGIATTTPSPTLASPTATASPTPSASLGPLTDAELLAMMPPEAAVDDVRGAIATAKFFLEQYPVVYETGDLRVWNALSEPGCVFCESVRSDVAATFADGDYVTGGEITIDENRIEANFFADDGYTYVTIPTDVSPSTIHHADGSTSPGAKGGPGSTSFRMSFNGSTWTVVGVGTERDS
jgi:hypothetical protein